MEHAIVVIMDVDLSQLFTVTDYKLVTVEIPCEEAENEERSLSIELSCSPQATTDFDLTGQILWPVSVLVSHYLASSLGVSRIRGRCVVELGAGTGLPSLVASQFAEQVVVTDGNDGVVLDLLKKNASSFTGRNEQSSNITAMQLVWGVREHLHKLLEVMKSVDVVIAADVVQWPAVVEPLLHTVKRLLWTSTDDDKEPIFILGIVNRASQTYDLFFRLARELGFRCRKAQASDYLQDGVVPASCSEFGGRETEVIELSLDDRTKPPLLLEEAATSHDMTLGSSFEHTSTLPC